jgi:hypothetical protein
MSAVKKKAKEVMFLHLPGKVVAKIRAGAEKAECSLSEYVARLVDASK